MTEVLSIQQPDGNTHFGSSLRRSSSQTSFLQNPPSYSRSTPSLSSYAAVDYETSKWPVSVLSSAPSSPRLAAPYLSNHSSYISTPSSNLSLDVQCDPTEEDIVFPSYEDGGYYCGMEEADPPSTPELSVQDAVTRPASDTTLTKPSYGTAWDCDARAGDDTTVEIRPTRHVDYLAHNWKEEDIWASWKHIVAKRKFYTNAPRLENASWRSWTKLKCQLKTVSPETLNWMKDHDTTWLYGPLLTHTGTPFGPDPTPSASQISRSNSFASKKPILKKRSLSEILLQRSVSSSTLMRQATDALRAQQPVIGRRERPLLGGRRLSDFVASSETASPFTRTTNSTSTTDLSASTSGVQTPCTRRHIHFNNEVEQCIAINKEPDDSSDYCYAIHDEDSSDDDVLTMKPVKHATKARIGSTPTTPRNSFSHESKTIAMLPSTTLNYRGDTPEPGEQQSKQKQKFWHGESKISPSPSQQTLKPSSSSNFLLDDEDEDADMDWQPSSFGGRRDSIYPSGGVAVNDSDDEDGTEHSGMRRTPSGMFMPYEDEDEDEVANTGIFGKVVDTVNTARDIAHVIWNVGWHR